MKKILLVLGIFTILWAPTIIFPVVANAAGTEIVYEVGRNGGQPTLDIVPDHTGAISVNKKIPQTDVKFVQSEPQYLFFVSMITMLVLLIWYRKEKNKESS